MIRIDIKEFAIPAQKIVYTVQAVHINGDTFSQTHTLLFGQSHSACQMHDQQVSSEVATRSTPN